MKWLLLSLVLCALVLAIHSDGNDETDHQHEHQDVGHDNGHLPREHDDDEEHDHDADEADDEKHDHHGGMKVGGKTVHHGWSYNLDPEKTGPKHWGTLFPDQCGSEMKRQSPINIKVDDAVHDDHLDSIDILEPNVDDADKRMYLYNNGHSAKLEIENAELYIEGGNLGSIFKVAQLHFHWGIDDKEGSEHRINDKQFPLEMHAVTYDSERYDSLGEAVKGDNSLAVFGTLYRLGEKDNANLNPIIQRLYDVTQPGKEFKKPISWFSIRSLMPPTTSKYFRYEGSLTTPSCDQSVVWTVFALPSFVSRTQLAEFRNLVEGTDDDGNVVQLANNWRPPQPLQGRKVKMSFVPEVEYEHIQEKKRKYKEGASTDNMASTLPSLTVLTSLMCLVIAYYFKH